MGVKSSLPSIVGLSALLCLAVAVTASAQSSSEGSRDSGKPVADQPAAGQPAKEKPAPEKPGAGSSEPVSRTRAGTDMGGLSAPASGTPDVTEAYRNALQRLRPVIAAYYDERFKAVSNLVELNLDRSWREITQRHGFLDRADYDREVRRLRQAYGLTFEADYNELVNRALQEHQQRLQALVLNEG